MFLDFKNRIGNFEYLLLGILIFVFCLIFYLPTYNYLAAYGDMGEYLNNPLRILNGELPYRDFWLLFPPGEVFLPALLYKVFGVNVNVVLISILITNALVAVAAFVLGRIIFNSQALRGNFWAFLTSLLVFFNGVMGVYVLFVLLAASVFVKYLEIHSHKYLVLTGILTGLAFYFRIFEVGAAVLAFGLVFVADAVDLKLGMKRFLKLLSVFAGSFLITVLLIYLPFLDVWPGMFKQLIFETLDHGTSMNLPYFYEARFNFNVLKDELRNWLDGGALMPVIYQMGAVVRMVVLYLVPFVVAVMLIFNLFLTYGLRVLVRPEGRVRDKIGNSDFTKILICFFLLWGLFAFFKALGRSDIAHLVHSITPFIFLIIILFRFYKNLFLKFCIGFLMLALLFQIPLKIWSQREVLARENFDINSENGRLLIDDQEEANAVNEVIQFINANTSVEDYIFVTPWFAPPIYALTERKNPSYYDSLIDIISRPSPGKQKKICDDLIEKNTKFVIHNSDWGFEENPGMVFFSVASLLQQCIEKNFELVKEAGRYKIYKN